MRRFTREEAEAYGEFLDDLMEPVAKKDLIKRVLERFEDANLASEAARDRIAEEIKDEING